MKMIPEVYTANLIRVARDINENFPSGVQIPTEGTWHEIGNAMLDAIDSGHLYPDQKLSQHSREVLAELDRDMWRLGDGNDMYKREWWLNADASSRDRRIAILGDKAFK